MQDLSQIPQPDRFKTVRAAAQYLGISKEAVYLMIREGTIGHYKFGKNAYRLATEDLDRFIESRMVPAKEKP